MLSKYTILVNASAKSPTSVNALAGNGVGHPVPERMVGKPKSLFVPPEHSRGAVLPVVYRSWKTIRRIAHPVVQ
jgi:hypothetical protein